jgi:putative ABC transport system ATP-binding protein
LPIGWTTALFNSPAVSTGNLDSKTGDEIMQILDRLNRQGRTIIMVTHEPDVARRAKRQIHMKDGVVAGTGIFQG